MSNAAQDVIEMLEDGETVEAVVFGDWGWRGLDEPVQVVPVRKGVVLTWAEARPMMQWWSFNNGSQELCYGAHVWTTARVFWVSEYDGSTGLASAPRNPVAHMPGMF